jgi:hypothetical protein
VGAALAADRAVPAAAVVFRQEGLSKKSIVN